MSLKLLRFVPKKTKHKKLIIDIHTLVILQLYEPFQFVTLDYTVLD